MGLIHGHCNFQFSSLTFLFLLSPEPNACCSRTPQLQTYRETSNDSIKNYKQNEKKKRIFCTEKAAKKHLSCTTTTVNKISKRTSGNKPKNNGTEYGLVGVAIGVGKDIRK